MCSRPSGMSLKQELAADLFMQARLHLRLLPLPCRPRASRAAAVQQLWTSRSIPGRPAPASQVGCGGPSRFSGRRSPPPHWGPVNPTTGSPVYERALDDAREGPRGASWDPAAPPQRGPSQWGTSSGWERVGNDSLAASPEAVSPSLDCPQKQSVAGVEEVRSVSASTTRNAFKWLWRGAHACGLHDGCEVFWVIIAGSQAQPHLTTS